MNTNTKTAGGWYAWSNGFKDGSVIKMHPDEELIIECVRVHGSTDPSTTVTIYVGGMPLFEGACIFLQGESYVLPESIHVGDYQQVRFACDEPGVVIGVGGYLKRRPIDLL